MENLPIGCHNLQNYGTEDYDVTKPLKDHGHNHDQRQRSQSLEQIKGYVFGISPTKKYKNDNKRNILTLVFKQKKRKSR